MIQPTEACTVIDVNTGKAISGKTDTEGTFFNVNLEASDEIARQIRLRNLSGIIIVDFIDMESEVHKKTLMRHLVTWYAEHIAGGEGRQVLLDVVATPVSPELLPGAQHTEKLLGSYDLHEFFLWHTVRYGETPEFLRKAAEQVFAGKFTAAEIGAALEVFSRRFQRQQFKRNPMPDGAKAGTFSLSPRGDWLTPSDGEMPLL